MPIGEGIHLPGSLEFIVARSTLGPKHAPRHQHKPERHQAALFVADSSRYPNWPQAIARACTTTLRLFRSFPPVAAPAAARHCPFSVAIG